MHNVAHLIHGVEYQKLESCNQCSSALPQRNFKLNVNSIRLEKDVSFDQFCGNIVIGSQKNGCIRKKYKVWKKFAPRLNPSDWH